MAANIAVASVLAVGAAVASAATAAADPPPPVPADPVVPDPAPTPVTPDALGTMNTILGQAGQPAGPGGPPDFLLSQNSVPALPGSQPASPLGDGSALNTTGYLLPANATMTAQEQGNSMYGLGPAGDNDTAPPQDKWDAIRRARGLFHGVMGKLPEDQLGEPLPGTAPPPGTNLPVGTNW